ncbi:MAG UNVERIFIED_CONTAM: DUF1730 domain-containing protein [Anaerolineae bacterium]|jgi:epoxyqueuosine reductase
MIFALTHKNLDLTWWDSSQLPPQRIFHTTLAWVEAQHYGEMGYLARSDRVARRRDLSLILPDVRSMIVVGMDYRPYIEDQSILNDPARGRIASYAWHLDYHPVLLTRLHTLASKLGMPSPSNKCYVDTGAIFRAQSWVAGRIRVHR